MFSFYINDHFFNDFIDHHHHIVVYGYTHCRYAELNWLLETLVDKEGKKFFQSVQDFSLGIPSNTEGTVETLANRSIFHISYSNSTPTHWIGLKSKAGITNLLIENYKRFQENLPIIRLLFVSNLEGWEFETSDPVEDLNCKKPKKIFSHQELRRIYKHLNDPNESIKGIAEKTFIFIKMVHPSKTELFNYYKETGKIKNNASRVSTFLNEEGNFHLDRVKTQTIFTPVQINSPWSHNEKKMAELMAKRSEYKVSAKTNLGWRQQMLDELNRYHKEKNLAVI